MGEQNLNDFYVKWKGTDVSLIKKRSIRGFLFKAFSKKSERAHNFQRLCKVVGHAFEVYGPREGRSQEGRLQKGVERTLKNEGPLNSPLNVVPSGFSSASANFLPLLKAALPTTFSRDELASIGNFLSKFPPGVVLQIQEQLSQRPPCLNALQKAINKGIALNLLTPENKPVIFKIARYLLSEQALAHQALVANDPQETVSSLRTLANVFGDRFARGAGNASSQKLEGGDTDVHVKAWRNFLFHSDFKGIEKEKIESLVGNIISTLRLSSSTLANSIKQQLEKSGECFLDGGWFNSNIGSGHVMIYHIQKEADGSCSFRIFNRGAGIPENVLDEFRTKCPTFVGLKNVSFEAVTGQEFAQKLVEFAKIGPKDGTNATETILSYLGRERGNWVRDEELLINDQTIPLQDSETCSYRSLEAVIRYCIGPESFQKLSIGFKLFLLKQSLPTLLGLLEEKKVDGLIQEVVFLERLIEKFSSSIEKHEDALLGIQKTEADELIATYKTCLALARENISIAEQKKRQPKLNVKGLSNILDKIDPGHVNRLQGDQLQLSRFNLTFIKKGDLWSVKEMPGYHVAKDQFIPNLDPGYLVLEKNTVIDQKTVTEKFVLMPTVAPMVVAKTARQSLRAPYIPNPNTFTGLALYKYDSARQVLISSGQRMTDALHLIRYYFHKGMFDEVEALLQDEKTRESREHYPINAQQMLVDIALTNTVENIASRGYRIRMEALAMYARNRERFPGSPHIEIDALTVQTTIVKYCERLDDIAPIPLEDEFAISRAFPKEFPQARLEQLEQLQAAELQMKAQSAIDRKVSQVWSHRPFDLTSFQYHLNVLFCKFSEKGAQVNIPDMITEVNTAIIQTNQQCQQLRKQILLHLHAELALNPLYSAGVTAAKRQMPSFEELLKTYRDYDSPVLNEYMESYLTLKNQLYSLREFVQGLNQADAVRDGLDMDENDLLELEPAENKFAMNAQEYKKNIMKAGNKSSIRNGN